MAKLLKPLMYVMIVALNFRWQGQYSACKAWNTISEVRVISASNSTKMIVLVGMQEKLAQKSKRFLKLAYKKHRVSPVDLKN